MKSLQLIFLVLLFTSFQNEAYKGGEGDGFALGELIRFTTSVRENLAEKDEISVFPNPVVQGEMVNIKSTASVEFSLINSNGNVIYLGRDIRQFSTNTFAKGSYILQAKSGEHFQFIKVLIL